MDVSIIIVNYNTMQLTEECICSVIQMTEGLSYEIIVVDNASTDGSVEFFKDDSRIVFVSNPENIGFGRANNLGFKYSHGDYIFLLNSDTILKNNAVKIFYDEIKKLPVNVCCLGCRLIDSSGNVTYSYGRFPSIKNIIAKRILHLLPGDKYKSYSFNYLEGIENNFFYVDFIVGAAMFLRRNVIDQYGLFDEDFFLYYEETEMQYRYTAYGKKIGIISSPMIVHLEGGSSKKKSNSLLKQMIATHSLFLYMKKTKKNLYFLFFKYSFFFLSLPILLYVKYKLNDRIKYLSMVLKEKYYDE